MNKYVFGCPDSLEELIAQLSQKLGNLSVFLVGGKILGAMSDLSYTVEISTYEFYFGDQLVFQTDSKDALEAFLLGQFSVTSTS